MDNDVFECNAKIFVLVRIGMVWGSYGRTHELRATTQILTRNRWFFAKITGRRRIGKTTLIQQAIRRAGGNPVILRANSGLSAGRSSVSRE